MVIRIYSEHCFVIQKFNLNAGTSQMTFTCWNGDERFRTNPVTSYPTDDRSMVEEEADNFPSFLSHRNDLMEILGRFTDLSPSLDDSPPIYKTFSIRPIFTAQRDLVLNQVFPPVGPNYSRMLHISLKTISALATIICGTLALKNFVHYYRSQPIPSQSRFNGLKPCALYLTISVASLLFGLKLGLYRAPRTPFPPKPLLHNIKSAAS